MHIFLDGNSFSKLGNLGKVSGDLALGRQLYQCIFENCVTPSLWTNRIKEHFFKWEDLIILDQAKKFENIQIGEQHVKKCDNEQNRTQKSTIFSRRNCRKGWLEFKWRLLAYSKQN